jgi:hypothetical protein
MSVPSTSRFFPPAAASPIATASATSPDRKTASGLSCAVLALCVSTSAVPVGPASRQHGARGVHDLFGALRRGRVLEDPVLLVLRAGDEAVE